MISCGGCIDLATGVGYRDQVQLFPAIFCTLGLYTRDENDASGFGAAQAETQGRNQDGVMRFTISSSNVYTTFNALWAAHISTYT